MIDEEGDLTGIYRDDLPLEEMGDFTIERASEVEFAHERGLWEARKPDGTLIAEHRNRQKCIRLEVRYLEAELQGSPPDHVYTDADLRPDG